MCLLLESRGRLAGILDTNNIWRDARRQINNPNYSPITHVLGPKPRYIDPGLNTIFGSVLMSCSCNTKILPFVLRSESNFV